MSLPLPPSLDALRSTPGRVKRGVNLLAYGSYGSGKSFLAAHAPAPQLVLSCGGEAGINPYLDPGKVLDLFEINDDPEAYLTILESAIKHASSIGSVIVDPSDAVWSEWMDYYQTKLNVDEIKAGQWKTVKGPWNSIHKRLARAPFNLVYTSREKDIEFEKKSDGKMDIHAISIPAGEKKMPYLFDFMVLCQAEVNALKVPTGWHSYYLTKCRRPITMDPSKLHIGMRWRSHDKQPQDPWQQIVQPFLTEWQETAESTPHILEGEDLQTSQEANREFAMDASLMTFARLSEALEAVTTLEEGRRLMTEVINPESVHLSPTHRTKLNTLIDATKARLTAAPNTADTVGA